MYSDCMKDFRARVLYFIKKVPPGKVVSYGQVAAAAGSPRAARQVGGILRTVGEADGIPWWRVVNNKGVISIKGNWTANKEQQRNLLAQEGIEISENFTIDMVRYRYKAKNTASFNKG
jgi:methylated-DNA-protein-cysteine methyltransferase-like protein